MRLTRTLTHAAPSASLLSSDLVSRDTGADAAVDVGEERPDDNFIVDSDCLYLFPHRCGGSTDRCTRKAPVTQKADVIVDPTMSPEEMYQLNAKHANRALAPDFTYYERKHVTAWNNVYCALCRCCMSHEQAITRADNLMKHPGGTFSKFGLYCWVVGLYMAAAGYITSQSVMSDYSIPDWVPKALLWCSVPLTLQGNIGQMLLLNLDLLWQQCCDFHNVFLWLNVCGFLAGLCELHGWDLNMLPLLLSAGSGWGCVVVSVADSVLYFDEVVYVRAAQKTLLLHFPALVILWGFVFLVQKQPDVHYRWHGVDLNIRAHTMGCMLTFLLFEASFIYAKLRRPSCKATLHSPMSLCYYYDTTKSPPDGGSQSRARAPSKAKCQQYGVRDVIRCILLLLLVVCPVPAARDGC